jgi:uncharacterized integral membrane protein
VTEETPREPLKDPSPINYRLIGILALVAVVVVVLFQNTELTTVKILFWTFEMPRWLLLSLHFVAGGAAGLVLARVRRKRKERPLTGR